MRIGKTSLTLAELSSLIGKGYFLRVVRGKTFVCKRPDMSNVKYSEAQKKQQDRFAKAVKFAKSFVDDPSKKRPFKVKKGQSIYSAAVSFYMKNNP